MTAESQPSIGDLMAASVPMVRTLNLEYLETTPQRAVVALPDQPEYRNHVHGPHAGAMFTVGESASGAVTIAAFSEQLARAVPLPVRVEVSYKKVARGRLTATATLQRPVREVLDVLESGVRPEFPVHVSLTREDGAEVGEMTVVWTLRPND